MDKKKADNKDKIIAILRKRIDMAGADRNQAIMDEKVGDEELGLLLSELQIFQLELEMQNEELAESANLLESERSKFAGFFNLAPVGYFILDHIGMVVEANQTGADLLNIGKQRLTGKRFQSFVDPENWELFYAFLHSMQTSENKQSCELSLLLPDRSEMYTRMEGSAIYDSISKKTQYYIAVIDVSESRISQQKLKDTTQRLEMTLNASETGTWTMEPGNNKVFLDDYSYTLLGINPWEFDGSAKGFIAMVHPEDQARLRQQLLSAIHISKEIDLEFRIITKDAKIKTMCIKGKEAYGPAKTTCFAGILMDVTEKLRIAEESKNLQNEKQRIILSAAFDAQEKERYRISSALHDSVCQILYGIRMNLQNIQTKLNLADELRGVNSLLDQAVRETRELSYELTPSVLRDFGFSAGVREMAHRFSTPSFSIKTTIRSSADKLHQDIQLYIFRIIQELISNCIKHAKASMAEVKVYTENDSIRLIVADNGKGFVTNTDDALLKGSGLRAIKNRVFLLSGTMDLHSSETGTTITIIFKNSNRFSEAAFS
jgi:PAS domain S-box-containing protein